MVVTTSKDGGAICPGHEINPSLLSQGLGCSPGPSKLHDQGPVAGNGRSTGTKVCSHIVRPWGDKLGSCGARQVCSSFGLAGAHRPPQAAQRPTPVEVPKVTQAAWDSAVATASPGPGQEGFLQMQMSSCVVQPISFREQVGGAGLCPLSPSLSCPQQQNPHRSTKPRPSQSRAHRPFNCQAPSS